MYPETKRAIESVNSRIQTNVTLNGVSCVVPEASYNLCKHDKIKNDKDYKNKILKLNNVQNDNEVNSKINSKVFSSAKNRLQGKVKSLENNLCPLNPLIFSVKQHLCQNNRPFFAYINKSISNDKQAKEVIGMKKRDQYLHVWSYFAR